MRQTVEKFVDLVQANNKLEGLSDTEVQLLAELLRLGRWGTTDSSYELKPGYLKGHYRDQDGSSTGETYPINSRCPYKVVVRDEGQERDAYGPTIWLEDATNMALGTRNWGPTPSREEIIDKLAEAIQASRPLPRIQITADGDELGEYPPQTGGLHAKHKTDEDSVSTCVGVHAYCNGWVDRRGATKTHDALVCRSCHLRVLFPKEVKTFGDLREVMKQKVKAA